MPDVLREAFDYPFSRLDPTGAHIDPPSVAIYEPLMAKGPDWQPYPLLAESSTVSDGGLRWTIRLRRDARFHSGAPCTAAAVVEAFDFLRYGGFEAGDQLWYWDPVRTTRAIGEDRIEIDLHYPYARLPALLWGTHTAVYHEALRLAEPDRFGYAVADGTGPYRLVSWSEERVVAERFDGYPRPSAPFLAERGAPPRRIEWVALLEPSDRLAALEAGDVHCIHGPPLDAVDRLVDEGRFTVVEFPQQSSVYLAVNFDCDAQRFGDVRMRRALSLALDRDALVRDVLHGHGEPSYGAIPKGDEHYDPAPDGAGRHDPVEAARLLDELGAVTGSDGVRRIDGQPLAVRCVCQDDRVLRPLAEAVRDQLARVGVRLELEPVTPFAPFYDAAATRPPAVLSKWLWPDAVDALIGFTASRGRPHDNWQQASVPALDAAYAEWLRAEGDGLRTAAARVQAIMADQLPYISLVTPHDVWVHVPELAGYRPYKANLYPFYQPVRLPTPA